MSNWQKVRLGDVLNFRRGHDLPKYDMKEGDIPVAGSNGIIGYHDIATSISPCITIGRSGNVGTPYMYEKCWAHNTTLYIDDYKGNNPKYIYYLLKTLNLGSYGGGSAVPTLNRNHIHPIDIFYTSDVAEQENYTYDSKNNVVITTLSEYVQYIAKLKNELDPRLFMEFGELFSKITFATTDDEIAKYNDELEKRFPYIYKAITDFNTAVAGYADFVKNTGVLTDFNKYLIIYNLDK